MRTGPSGLQNRQIVRSVQRGLALRPLKDAVDLLRRFGQGPVVTGRTSRHQRKAGADFTVCAWVGTGEIAVPVLIPDDLCEAISTVGPPQTQGIGDRPGLGNGARRNASVVCGEIAGGASGRTGDARSRRPRRSPQQHRARGAAVQAEFPARRGIQRLQDPVNAGGGLLQRRVMRRTQRTRHEQTGIHDAIHTRTHTVKLGPSGSGVTYAS